MSSDIFILWWTLHYDTDRYNFYRINKCGLPYTCQMTLNRSYYEESPLVIFQQWQMDLRDLPPKEDVYSGKKAWIYNSVEAPTSHARNEELGQLFAYRWTNWFNSDFVESYFVPGLGPDSFIGKVLQPPLMTLETKNALRLRSQDNKRGLAPVAWIVSDCDSVSGRRLFVYQLRKYVNIDIYGRGCMTNREWPRKQNGDEFSPDEIAAQYKFYLAIENINCDDYVTEKLLRAYEVGAIPIVDGPLDYSRFDATGNALVQSDHFDNSPKKLGRYIQQLDQDDTLYLDKLRYKVPKDPHYTPTTKDLSRVFLRTWANNGSQSVWGPDMHGAECSVCELAHDLNEGLVKLDMSKKIGVDRTCVMNKHKHITWILEYNWFITLPVLLLVALVIYALTRKTIQRLVRGTLGAIFPSGWIPHKYSHLNQSYEYSKPMELVK
ncbi:Alpha 1,3 fucosyltransferase [Podila horticola]|nr:Alpha 1,3 fucosyltransferase [Podila horticola]